MAKTLIMQKSKTDLKTLSNFIPTDNQDAISVVEDMLVGQTAVFKRVKKIDAVLPLPGTRLAKFYISDESFNLKLHFNIEVSSARSQEDIIKYFKDNPITFMGKKLSYVKFYGLIWFTPA